MNATLKFKPLTTLLLTMAIALILGSEAQAQTTLNYFDFNGSSNQTRGIKNGILSNTFAAGDVTLSSSGTATNLQSPSTAPGSLNLVAGTRSGVSPNFTYANNGKFVELQTSSAGYMGLNLSFATERSSTGFNNNQLSYSIDGVNYVAISSYNPAASFTPAPAGLQSFNLSNITALDNKATSIYFRIIFDGATNAAGSNRIDNLLLTATETPAPPGLASLLIGLCISGWKARRRKT